jgi:hypothetical protein
MTHERQSLLKLSLTFFAVGVIALWVLVANSGCGPVVRNTGIEKKLAPTSNFSREQAANTAAFIALTNGGTYSAIAPTGSMEPIVDSRSFVVMAPHKGNLRVGMVVGFYRDPAAPRVLHRVVKVNDTHFIPNGITNQNSDGWIPRENIYGELIAIVYANE